MSLFRELTDVEFNVREGQETGPLSRLLISLYDGQAGLIDHAMMNARGKPLVGIKEVTAPFEKTDRLILSASVSGTPDGTVRGAITQSIQLSDRLNSAPVTLSIAGDSLTVTAADKPRAVLDQLITRRTILASETTPGAAG